MKIDETLLEIIATLAVIILFIALLSGMFWVTFILISVTYLTIGCFLAAFVAIKERAISLYHHFFE